MGIQLALFVSGILLARSLGPAARGDLAVVLVLPVVAVQLMGAGLPSAVTYYVARNRLATRLILRRLAPVAGLQMLLGASALIVLCALFLGGKARTTQTAGWLTLLIVPLLTLQIYGNHVLQGLGELRLFNTFRVATPAVFCIGLASGLLIGLTVIICTAIWLAGILLVTIAMVIALSARVPQRDPDAELGDAVPSRSDVIRFGTAGFLAQVSPVETFRVDTLVVASLFPSQVVGYYAVALSISNPPRFVADAIVAVAYPHIAAQDPAHGRASSKRYLIAATVACGAAAVTLALAAPFLIPMLFGRAFEPAVALTSILVIGAGLVSVRRVGTDCLRAMGRPARTTAIEIATLVVLTAGFVILGRWGEGKGVAVALAVSATAGLVLTLRSLLAPPERARRRTSSRRSARLE